MKKLKTIALLPVFVLAAFTTPHASRFDAVVAYSAAAEQEPQDPVRVEVPRECPKRKSVIKPGSPTSFSSGPTTTCADGTACGYVFTYNPPATECQSTQLLTCCVEQLQRGYLQTFSCVQNPNGPLGATICKGGAKSPFGSSHIVYVTVDCKESSDGGYECQKPGDY